MEPWTTLQLAIKTAPLHRTKFVVSPPNEHPLSLSEENPDMFQEKKPQLSLQQILERASYVKSNEVAD